MSRLAVLVIAGATLVGAMMAARADGPVLGSAVIRADLPESVVAGEYQMESLVEGNNRAVKQVDSVKLEVKEQKIAGKYLATQSGNGLDSTFAGEWEKGSTAVLALHQSSPDGYHAFYILQAAAKDSFSGTWMDNQDHHGSVKITLKKAAEK